MRTVIVLLCYSFAFAAIANNNSERMSARDLYYKLLKESSDVEISEQEEAKQKQIEAWKKMDRHHKLQRIGPDPKPEFDQTLQIPVDPSPLNPPYTSGDLQREPKTVNTPNDDGKNSAPLLGPPDDPIDNPDRPYNVPSTPLVAPDNPANKNNPLLPTDKQRHFIQDQEQPLKTPEDRSKDITPHQIKNNPLNDQTD